MHPPLAVTAVLHNSGVNIAMSVCNPDEQMTGGHGGHHKSPLERLGFSGPISIDRGSPPFSTLPYQSLVMLVSKKAEQAP